MKKLKLTELQTFKLWQAKENMDSVLREIKGKPLAGCAKEKMQTLEMASQSVEVVLL